MSKARAAGVLGALILCGLLFLSNLVIAQKDNYFARLQGAVTRGCLELALLPNVAPDDGSTPSATVFFFDACTLFVHALKDVTPSLTPSNSTLEEFEDAFLGEMAGFIVRWAARVDAQENACDECVQVVQDVEIFLAANGTAASLEDALLAGCEERFSNPTEADQCRQIVEAVGVPVLVDFILGNFPPLTLCRELNFCPPGV
jgi:hypothetical protein